MAQPVWITAVGSLGTIPENVFYQVPLLAYDPSDPDNPDSVYYQLIAGSLPDGVQCTKTGLIEGVPKAIASLQGVPTPVAQDVTSKFAVRAYTEKVVNGKTVVDRLADRTFTLTVAGPDAPVFVTPAGSLGTFIDGAPIDPIQVQISDDDPGQNIVVSVAFGQFPPGLSISPSGLISGYIIPLNSVNATAGFSRDEQGFDQYPFDFATRSPNTNYQFTLEVTDGISSDLRSYEIYVYSRSTFSADTTDITSDDTFITADLTPDYTPFLVNAEPSDLGTVRSDNFFAYQFIAKDFDEETTEYWLYDSAPGLGLPPGLQLDYFTGWLYGYIPDMGATENTYEFGVYLKKSNQEEIFSSIYYFSLTVIGQISRDVIWITPSNMGTIANGATSLLKIEAINTGGRVLQYRLDGGTDYNRLPQGLTLLSSGDIAGRVSFNTFALDLGTTTFDVTTTSQLRPNPTTFDMSCTFTVNAFSSDGYVNVYKTFTVTVVREFNRPYENLYIKAMPPLSDRALVNSLLQNPDIIPTDLLFRPTDANFGVAKNVIYTHAYGLTSATLTDYVRSLDINHYWKNLVLGSIKTAQALDQYGNVIYEVVYSQVIDDLVNSQLVSVSKEVTLPYTVSVDGVETNTVYPNSLVNMRDQVIDVVGQSSNLLPLWMLSKQQKGQVLGFTPAWVICYVKPGTSGQVAYNIKTEFGDQLNRVDFKVDRYELDRLLSIHWDPVADAWEPAGAETTFDLVLHYTVDAIDGSLVTPYAIGDQILVSGSDLGGLDDINDMIITILDVSSTGLPLIVTTQGQAALFSDGAEYPGVVGTNLIGTGSGMNFYIIVGSGETTVFDSSSMRFEAPVDNYTNTDAYDKYLVFPRRTILA